MTETGGSGSYPNCEVRTGYSTRSPGPVRARTHPSRIGKRRRGEEVEPSHRKRYRIYNLDRRAPKHETSGPAGLAYDEDGFCFSTDQIGGEAGAVEIAKLLAKVTGERIVVLDAKRAGALVWSNEPV
jgi:hypothetical protein